METQRILMRSLAVVVFASVIWTITGAYQKDITCCTAVSGLTREQFTDTIISYRMLKQRRECLKAIVLKTERGDFCFNWRLPWVKEEAKLLRAQRNNYLTSTLTPVGGQTNLSRDRGDRGRNQKVIRCCFTANHPIISCIKQSQQCLKAIVFETALRGEFCFDLGLPWVLGKVKQVFIAHRNKA